MRLTALLLVGIAIPNVYMKYLLVAIDGDETPEVDTESDTEAEQETVPEKNDDRNGDMKNDNNVDEETDGTSRSYKSNYTIIFRLLG